MPTDEFLNALTAYERFHEWFHSALAGSQRDASAPGSPALRGGMLQGAAGAVQSAWKRSKVPGMTGDGKGKDVCLTSMQRRNATWIVWHIYVNFLPFKRFDIQGTYSLNTGFITMGGADRC